ncbi:hypothetical protein AJ78_07099 [Emergomyces pasteurianus Ep9510]|uniref:Aminoglycoside phosphotransferase domain-containing protein n=1 Tax=Emergomyces pasteurianus Ep9510 TaxID=1447872 RepID=A0A1J9P850_9EURO|nr:hypothetical protein AJ78_07099 [Emergomyces pasteurianus Ep9510]
MSNMGFLVMEFIDVISLEKISLRRNILKSFKIWLKQYTVSASESGIPRGYLFSEDGAGKSLSSMRSFNSWLDERARLTASETAFDFQLSDCVFCHMDLTRQNIILQGESIYLLGWEYAGFYPREFEKYTILFIGQKEDYNFAQDLTKALDSLYQKEGMKTEDEHIIGLLDRVYRNNLKYICMSTQKALMTHLN